MSNVSMFNVLRLLCVLLCVNLFVAASAFAAAPTSAQLNQARIMGLAWLMSHQAGDGSWQSAGGLTVQPTSAALDAFANAGIKQGHPYAAAEAWLGNTNATSTDSLSRKTIALYHAGINVNALISQLLLQRDDLSKDWGAYPKYQADFLDSALATNVYLVTGASYSDLNASLSFIANNQNAGSGSDNGGWPYSTSAPIGSPGSLIPTAYNVLMLSNAKAKGWGVDSFITHGVTWLAAHAKADGGFSDDALASTGAPLETALAYIALNQAKIGGNAAAIAAQATIDNASNFLVVNQGADGNWENDPFATALALQTLPTLASGALTDSNKSGVPDQVETAQGLNPTTPDHSALGNGQSMIGVTTSKFVGGGAQLQPFSSTLTASGGTAPYIWRVVSGNLPDGLNLNATTGLISGTPNLAGTFNFSYTVTDASSASTTVQGQITIVDNTDVPTLPQWGIIVMAMLLMGLMALTQRKNYK